MTDSLVTCPLAMRIAIDNGSVINPENVPRIKPKRTPKVRKERPPMSEKFLRGRPPTVSDAELIELIDDFGLDSADELLAATGLKSKTSLMKRLRRIAARPDAQVVIIPHEGFGMTYTITTRRRMLEGMCVR